MDTNIVTTTEYLMQVIEKLSDSDVIAIDTEFIRGNGKAVLCLIQLASSKGHAIIDPLALSDLSPIFSLLENPNITKIFHACDQDLDVLNSYNCNIKNIFDTQTADMFLTSAHIPNYETLVKKYCNVQLSKLYTTSDWTVRPLSKGQLRYAINDVLYLLPIYRKQQQKLQALNRLQWVIEESNNKLNTYSKNVSEQFHDFIPKLSAAGIEALNKILVWRQEVAQKEHTQDIRVIKNDIIISLLKHGKIKLKQLKMSRLSNDDNHMLDFIKFVGRNLDFKEVYVKPVEAINNAQSEVIKYLKLALDLTSSRVHIHSDLIANNEMLAGLIQGDSNNKLLQGWRFEIFGQFAQNLLCGTHFLKINQGRIDIVNE